jgi:hypothetical protein
LLALTNELDFELELAFFISVPTEHFERVPVEKTEEHIFGIVLPNGWMVRSVFYSLCMYIYFISFGVVGGCVHMLSMHMHTRRVRSGQGESSVLKILPRRLETERLERIRRNTVWFDVTIRKCTALSRLFDAQALTESLKNVRTT